MVAISILLAFVLGAVASRVGLPPLVGFLVAGFALNALGYESDEMLEEISHLGVLLLLFTVGLKVRLKNLVRAEVWGTALVHLGVSVAVIGAALHFGLGVEPHAAVLLGAALGFSSTVVAAKGLEEKRELRAFHGRVTIGILIIQDLAAVGVLSLGGGHAPSPWAIGLLGLVLVRPVLVRLLDVSGHGELFVLFGVLLAVAAGGAGFELLGLSGELGALLFGAMLADHQRANELAQALWGLKEVILVGFFLSIGMSGLPTLASLEVAAVLVLVVVPLKAALFFLLLVAFRLRARSSFLSATALASFSEFGLIVVALGVQQDVLADAWLVHVALAVAMSFALAAPITRAAHGVYERLAAPLSRLERAARHPDDAPISLGSAEIAILGMGRVGTGAYEFLRSRSERVVGLDSDPGKVQVHLSEGRRVVYADAEDPGLWQRLNLDGVRAVLLAVPDLEAKIAAITQLRRRGYRGLISATNVYPGEAGEILQAGCTTTYNYFDEAGVGFAEHTWEALHPQEAAAE